MLSKTAVTVLRVRGVSVGGKTQDARVNPNRRVIVSVPPGLTGSTIVVVTGFGGTATNELTLG